MKKLLFLLSVVICNSLSAQNITLLSENDSYRFETQPEDFEYIDYQMDLSDVETFVASFKVIIDKYGEDNLEKSFDHLWTLANKMGANAFSIEEIGWENEKYTAVIDIYFLDNNTMQQNFSFYEDNIVVVFGDLNTENMEKEKTFKAGKEKISLFPYQYIKLQNEPGKKLKLSIGGLMGTSVTIKGERDRLGECFTLGGLSVNPAGGGITVYGGNRSSGVGMGVGISLKTGNIYPMPLNFGLFTMTILDTVKNFSSESEIIISE